MNTRAKQIVGAGGLTMLLAATVSAWGAGHHHGPPPSQQVEGLFGGVLPSAEEFATYPKALPPGAFAARNGGASVTPTRFTIPDSKLPPVQAQGTPEEAGSPGSCEVWSAGYAMGSYTANLTNRKPIKNLKNTVSAAFVYALVLNEEGIACPSGTKPGDTLNYLVENTAPSLHSVPYQPSCSYLGDIDTTQTCDSDPAFCTNLSIGSWSAFSTPIPADALADIQGLVAQSRIVQITIVVPWEFGEYRHGVFNAPTACPTPAPSQGPKCAQSGPIACVADHSTPSGCAQHGVAIVGYDDTMPNPAGGTPGAVRIMNSFGHKWGEKGFMWMSYATFEEIYRTATVAEPPAASSVSGVAITDAFQWVERRAGQTPQVHLIFETQFEGPLRLGEVSITAPDGQTVTQTHGHRFRNGHLYITRHDGQQFEAGTYVLRARGTTRQGVPVDVTATADVELAAGETFPAGPLPAGVTGTNREPVH